MTDEFRVLILGHAPVDVEFSTRENFSRLSESSHRGGVEALRSFTEASDFVLANLPVPVQFQKSGTVPAASGSAATEWSASDQAWIDRLAAARVDAVHLTPRVRPEIQVPDLDSVLGVLDMDQLTYFGCGRTDSEALKPLSVKVPDTVGGGEIRFHGLSETARSATQHSHQLGHGRLARFAPLTTADIPRPRAGSSAQDVLHVAMANWGARTTWRTTRQYSLVHQLLNKDFDLVLGTGTPGIQEVHRKRQRWVVYGLGGGPTSEMWKSEFFGDDKEKESFSFWSIIEVRKNLESRRITLKLYPMKHQKCDNKTISCPASAEELTQIVRSLSDRPIRRWRFTNPALTADADELGPHLNLDMGEWPTGHRPARLEPVTRAGDPNEWPLMSPDRRLEDAAINFNKPSGAMTLPLGAQASGADVKWLSNSTSVVDANGRRFLTYGPTAHESSLGSRIVSDKLLTARLLAENRVSTPQTLVADTPQDAVEAAEKIPGSVVIKPRAGNKSRGVSTNLMSESEVLEGFAYAAEFSHSVLVQQYIEVQDEIRVVASPEEVVAVNVRVYPHVVGDGSSTIEELIRDKNLQRSYNTIFKRGQIPIDEVTVRYLSRHDIGLTSVPNMGQCVTVRNVGGNSVGADIKQALHSVDPRIIETAKRAIGVVPGLRWGGVDIVTDRVSGEPFVIEINTNAGFLSAAFPTYGEPRDVTQDIFRLRLADTKRAPVLDSPVDTPQVHPTPIPLWPSHGHEGFVTRGIRDLMHDSWTKESLEIVSVSQNVRIVRAPDGTAAWVTANGRTSDDRHVVGTVMKRVEVVHALLDDAEIPRARSSNVTSTAGLRRFVGTRARFVGLMSGRSGWSWMNMEALSAQEARSLDRLPSRNVLVQSRPTGRHLRVLATLDKAWVITEPAPEGALSPAEIEAVSQIAVRAVRSIPELRWAAVEVALRSRRLVDGRPNPVLVEGMAMVPQFTAEDHVVAGDVEGFCRHVIGL